MSQEQEFLPAVIKGQIKEKGEHDMLFLSALELAQIAPYISAMSREPGIQ